MVKRLDVPATGYDDDGGLIGRFFRLKNEIGWKGQSVLDGLTEDETAILETSYFPDEYKQRHLDTASKKGSAEIETLVNSLNNMVAAKAILVKETYKPERSTGDKIGKEVLEFTFSFSSCDQKHKIPKKYKGLKNTPNQAVLKFQSLTDVRKQLFKNGSSNGTSDPSLNKYNNNLKDFCDFLDECAAKGCLKPKECKENVDKWYGEWMETMVPLGKR